MIDKNSRSQGLGKKHRSGGGKVIDSHRGSTMPFKPVGAGGSNISGAINIKSERKR